MTGILLGQYNFDAPQETLCKNNTIDGLNSLLLTPSEIGIRCHESTPQ